jgi:hypothetical protein
VPASDAVHQLRYTATSGVEAGGPVLWWGDVAHDQRPTDAYSLVYDSEPLAESVEILGMPQAVLKVAADAVQANWFVRLSDVAPDGTVTLITGAGFNGTHRNSAREPEMIEPGISFPLKIEMHFTSWTFPTGHRIRLSVSNAQWPMFWPTPYQMTTRLQLGGDDGSHFILPLIPRSEERAPKFLPIENADRAEGYESLEAGTSSGYGEIETVERNLQNSGATVVSTNHGSTQYPWGTESFRERIEFKSSDSQPENSSVNSTYEIEVKVEDRVLIWRCETTFNSDVHNFYYHYTRHLTENGEPVRTREWSKTIPRDHQ